MIKNQKGIAHLLLIVVAVVALAGVALVIQRSMSKRSEVKNQGGSTAQASVAWSFDGEKWQASGTPPACPSPLKLPAPVEVGKVTHVLYPGQFRTGGYKTHGGFYFDGAKNTDIKVTVPLDAQLVKGSRYIERGELQYFFVFINPCGIMYRFDHLAKLTPKFQAI